MRTDIIMRVYWDDYNYMMIVCPSKEDIHHFLRYFFNKENLHRGNGVEPRPIKKITLTRGENAIDSWLKTKFGP